MNFSNNWRDRRTVFGPTHYSIANYSTESKSQMKASYGEDLLLNNFHLIPESLMKNLADTIITEEKMAPKSKLENNIDVKTDEDMLNQPDYSPLAGITNFFSGVFNVISSAMFSKPKQADFGSKASEEMAVPSMWHGAKHLDENKTLQDENRSNDMASELLVSDMTDCRTAAAHCQNKLEQVRILLGSKPVPCTPRARRRPKKAFIEAGSVEDCFEDAFSPEDFENIANDSYIQYSSPACYQDHVFCEIDGPKLKIETADTPKAVSEARHVCETTELVENVPEIDNANDNKLECDKKKELVASCEDKISKLKALLEKSKKLKTVIEPEPVSVPELTDPPKDRSKLPNSHPSSKVKDKRYKNPNRCSGKRLKSKMKKNIQDDALFADEMYSEDLSSVENSPSLGNLNKFITKPLKIEKEYFDEVSGRFHSASTTESEDSFQIVFSDSPRQRRASDCESEDSFIVFEETPDSCYTSNDVFGESNDSDDYDSDSDLSDSGCGNMTFNLASSLSKSVCNLADDSLYVECSEDEVDFPNLKEVWFSDCASVVRPGDLNTGLLINEQKKLQRRGLPPKRVRFSPLPPKVHVMRVWSFAARQARPGPWEDYARDRERFKRRIADVEVAVSWVLKPQHRSRVMFQRFMPWWNALKRKELAEKKEKEEQERLREEEKLKTDETEKRKAVEECRGMDNKDERIADLSNNNTTSRNADNDLYNNKEGEKELNLYGEEEKRDLAQNSEANGNNLEENSNVVVNGELRTKELIENGEIEEVVNWTNNLDAELNNVKKDLDIKTTEIILNDMNIDNKSNMNGMTNNNQIISLNDKSDLVAQSISNT